MKRASICGATVWTRRWTTDDSLNKHRSTSHTEAHVTACKRHAVDAGRVVVIAGPRVLLQHVTQGSLFGSRKQRCQHLRNFHLQGLPLVGVNKTRTGVRMSIGISHVGLHIIDGRAIHEVGTLHMDYGAVIAVQLHLFYTHTRQAKPIGTEGRA